MEWLVMLLVILIVYMFSTRVEESKIDFCNSLHMR